MRSQAAVDQPLGSTRTLLKEHGGAADVESRVRRTVLPGGLRVITEEMPGSRSATLGLWTTVGARDEAPSLAGATHFLEHLLFKGTHRRTALDISVELDAVGGELNAFTGKEYTCYHARVLGVDVPLAVDVLCDMVTSSTLPGREVESEREVILDEIAMHDDDPDDVAHDAFLAAIYADTPLGRSITGSIESIQSLSRRQIAGHYRRRYTADQLVFAAAGEVDHAGVVRLVRRAFEEAEALGDPAESPAAVRGTGKAVRSTAGVSLVERPTEQASFLLGVPSYPRGDNRRFALGVLNAVLGAGTSSRLFQEVREQRGLAYTIYSFSNQFADAGTFAVAGGCLPDKLAAVLDICRVELTRLAADGVTESELRRGQGQLRGSLIMGLEDAGARMSRIAKSELVPGGLVGVENSLGRITDVSLDEVNEVAAELLGHPSTLAVVGPARALSAATRSS
ncbi:MAG: M16 family metallopeptidase [Nocardioidaceae bacterium]